MQSLKLIEYNKMLLNNYIIQKMLSKKFENQHVLNERTYFQVTER